MIDFLLAVIFYTLVIFYFIKNREKIVIQSKIFFLLRSKKGVKFFEKYGKKYSRFFNILGTISIFIVLLSLVFMTFFIVINLFNLIFSPSNASKLALVIPGLPIPGSDVYVPFIYGILSLFILIIVHEGSHAFLMAANKLKIKNTGVGFFLFLPLAFVEPDEEKFKKLNPINKAKIASAGPASNVFLSLLVGLILIFIITPLLQPHVDLSNVIILKVNDNSPAFSSNISEGEYVLSINNYEVKNISTITYLFNNVLKPNQIINFTTNVKSYSVKLSTNPNNSSKAYIGILFKQDYKIKDKDLVGNIIFAMWNLFFWLANLSLWVGLMNTLPVSFFDGGIVFSSILEYFFKSKEKVQKIILILSYFVFLTLILSLFLSYTI